ncbi:peptide deformylase [Sneathiella glossodoripedis]|uniref:peptide deformylase n=1 Tax=Sneathiella glossodoripedis TaxID=418853 RepID=UPI00046FC24E|nr:peptide deformylase [Sneathiella glossodoripedis]
MKIEPREILKMGNPLLRQISEPVDEFNEQEIRDLIELMRVSMVAANGVGLAAPQIGVLKRVVIFEVPAARISEEDGEISANGGVPQTVLINPKVTPLTEEKVLGWEGCLSVPGLRGLVPRYTRIKYEGLTLDNASLAGGGELQIQKISRDVSGFHARVVQHEVDHLDGVLYPERMTDIRQLIFQTELPSFIRALDEQAERK